MAPARWLTTDESSASCYLPIHYRSERSEMVCWSLVHEEYRAEENTCFKNYSFCWKIIGFLQNEWSGDQIL